MFMTLLLRHWNQVRTYTVCCISRLEQQKQVVVSVEKLRSSGDTSFCGVPLIVLFCHAQAWSWCKVEKIVILDSIYMHPIDCSFKHDRAVQIELLFHVGFLLGHESAKVFAEGRLRFRPHHARRVPKRSFKFRKVM